MDCPDGGGPDGCRPAACRRRRLRPPDARVARQLHRLVALHDAPPRDGRGRQGSRRRRTRPQDHLIQASGGGGLWRAGLFF